MTHVLQRRRQVGESNAAADSCDSCTVQPWACTLSHRIASQKGQQAWKKTRCCGVDIRACGREFEISAGSRALVQQTISAYLPTAIAKKWESCQVNAMRPAVRVRARHPQSIMRDPDLLNAFVL